MKQQIFPIFDPLTGNCIGYKPRELVHVDGDWHKGVQANIIRSNDKGTFDILIQQRSTNVDIGKHNFDQSLATQMLHIDHLDEEKTLARGLQEELNITLYKKVKLQYTMRIIKTYKEDLSKLNREFISLFIVLIDNKQLIKSKCKKIDKLQWMEWEEFLNFYSAQKVFFTKTAQFYFDTHDILHEMTKISLDLIQGQTSTDNQTKNNSLLHVHYHNATKETYKHDNNEIEKYRNILCASKEALRSNFQTYLPELYYAS